jgi:hypothetical protein
MNCQQCHILLEDFRDNKMSVEIKGQVEAHLAGCKKCAEDLQLINFSKKVIESEKAIQSNPFLSTRIMSSIEELELKQAEKQSIPSYQKVLRPALITISIAAAMFIGIMAGNLFQPKQPANQIPVELAYMNDAALESVNVFANE